MNLLASSASRWRIGRKEAAPTSPTAHRLAGFADHVGQDGEALRQFIVGYRERHERPNHVPVLPTAVKSIRPSCRAFSATLAARSLSERDSRGSGSSSPTYSPTMTSYEPIAAKHLLIT